jgi:hypothetical protein
MPVPQPFDYKMGELENLMSSLVVRVRSLNWMRGAPEADRDHARRAAREALQDLCDAVIDIINNPK